MPQVQTNASSVEFGRNSGGKSKEVSVLYLIPPVKTVSAGMLNKKESMSFTEQVAVARIQFSDGSVWQRP